MNSIENDQRRSSSDDRQIAPFQLQVPECDLEDLFERLARTRWPDRQTVDDWSQGAPLDKVQALCEYWRTHYDWRRCESMLNGFGQYKTTIDGLGIHFLHVRSPEPDALPMIMTHGWPGSIIEFHKVIGALTNPVAHGGDARDAFHLVIPSLPGFGFSDRPTETGWGVSHIADAWIEEMLDNIMLYWLPNAGASSARLYWESSSKINETLQIAIPIGFSVFPKDIARGSRRWADRRFSNIVYWQEVERGGHFAALEQPELFVREVQNCFRLVRG